MTNKLKRTFATGLGALFAVFCGGFIASSSRVNKLELNLQDNLQKLRSFTLTPSDEIIIVKLDKKFFKPEFQGRQKILYAQVANWFLQYKANVIVLNFPYEWRKTSSKLNSIPKNKHTSIDAIKNLIDNNQNRVLLVSPIHRIKHSHHNEIANYSHFIPLDEKVKDRFSYPQSAPQLQAFFEYENIESKNPSDLKSPARRAYAQGQIKVHYSQKLNLRFQSLAWLTIKKYFQNSSKKNNFFSSLPERIQISYWPPETFANNTFELTKLCTRNYETDNPCEITTTPQQREKIRDKIVIMGFTAGDELDVLPVKSPFGKMIDGIEAQANLLSSLITNSYYQTLPQLIVILIDLLGGAIIGLFMASSPSPRYWLYLGLSMVIGYGSLIPVAFFSGWILPIVSPILTWAVTAVAIAFYLKNNELIQENEGKKVIIAEEKAITAKAKQLIRGIWADIHGHPLQELKIAMYEIEFLSLPDAKSEPIIERLSSVATEIRKYLTLDLDSALTIQPELSLGLVVAMEKHLQKLTDSGKLQLQVITNLQPINEPQLSSNWICARDDIFRFFCEAVTNVVHHAQSATQVAINLSQEDEQCTLIIENDGEIVDNIDNEMKEGLGTKLMAEIVEYLPDGIWKRVALPDGGMRVTLHWKQKF